MAQNTTPEITSAADRAVATHLADPEHLQTLLSNLVHRAAYLAAKAEWTMEDNFSTTEWLAEDIGRELPEEDLIAIVGEGGFDLPPEDVETRLAPYLPEAEDLDEG